MLNSSKLQYIFMLLHTQLYSYTYLFIQYGDITQKLYGKVSKQIIIISSQVTSYICQGRDKIVLATQLPSYIRDYQTRQLGVSLQHTPGFLNCFSPGSQLHVCACVCLLLIMRLLISSGVMWHDINPILLVQQILQLLQTSVVSINSRCGLRIEVCCRNQPNRSKLALYNPLLLL